MDEKFLKLTNETYKLVDFFPESDPLKNRAKDKILAIMENLNSGLDVKKDIDILLGYFYIAKTLGWMNSTNYLIISNQYQKITQELELQEAPGQKLPVLPAESVLSYSGAMPDRQKIILEFLAKNQRAQVMDLQAILPNVTKRTIRRDLDELLQMGKIVRMGEFNQVFYQIKR